MDIDKVTHTRPHLDIRLSAAHEIATLREQIRFAEKLLLDIQDTFVDRSMEKVTAAREFLMEGISVKEKLIADLCESVAQSTVHLSESRQSPSPVASDTSSSARSHAARPQPDGVNASETVAGSIMKGN